MNFEANGYLGLSLNLNKVFESLTSEEYNTQAYKSRFQITSIEMKLPLGNCVHKKRVKFDYRPNRSVSHDL